MTADEQALLRAVLERPADDLPRLVYADWLDEHGQPDRAEFIRVQCELADLIRLGAHEDGSCNVTGPCADCHREAEVRRLRRRERELWVNNLAHLNWFPKLPGDPVVYALSCTGREDHPIALVRRGFVDEARCTLATFAGGACGRCGGPGRVRYYHPVEIEAIDDCPDCSGTGRTTGVAETLFRVHPITQMRLTDKRPSHHEFLGEGNWSWYRHSGLADADDLPDALFEFGVRTRPAALSANGVRLVFPDEASAWRLLADYGRDLAGLSPLPA